MRRITEDAHCAFNQKRKFKSSNTEVIVSADNIKLLLFNNEIVKEENGIIYICNGGWNSLTTKERLSPFVKQIRKVKDDIIINEKVKLTGNWLNLNDITQ
jgi:hypothetical protein